MSAISFTARVAEHFRAHPGRWINAAELEAIGGRFAWRTRVSDARRQFGLHILNRVRTVTLDDGSQYRVSEYMYLPADLLEMAEAAS